MQSLALSRCFCPCLATLLFSSAQTAMSSLKSVCVEDLGHLVQSPATDIMARSLSEIVQQLYANEQLSQECAHALSMQLGGVDSISRHQMQGDIAFTTEVSALTSESSCHLTPSMGLLHIRPDGRCKVTLHSVLMSVHSQMRSHVQSHHSGACCIFGQMADACCANQV